MFMLRAQMHWAALAAAVPITLAAAPAMAAGPEYPKTRTVDQVDTFFGVRVADPYRWLENADDPEVQAWVDAENRVTRATLDRIPLRSAVAERLAELLDYPRVELPVKRGDWVFFAKNSGLQNQSVLYEQKGLHGAPSVLLDPNTLSKDGTISLGATGYSRDGRFFAYGLSQSGSDWQELHVRDVVSGKDREDRIERSRFTDVAWAPDASGFYYSRYPAPGDVPAGEEEFWNTLYFHKLGEPQSKDRIVFRREDCKECGFLGTVTDDGHWLLVVGWKGTAPENELYVQRLGQTEAAMEPLFTGFDAAWEPIEVVDDELFLMTNQDAPRNRVVVVDLAGDRTPRPLIPQGDDIIEEVVLARDQLVVSTMHNAHSRLLAYGLDGNWLHDIELPTIGTVDDLSGKPGDPDLFISFTSFLFPTQNYTYDFQDGRLVLYQTSEIGFDRDAYVVRQIFYESKDGTKVPMFLVHRKGIRLDGQNPVLLYGYGGFNISMTPSFSTSRLFWLEQGGIYALANLRGGGEFGEEWHQAGTLTHKQNVFDDFIAAGEWLVDNGYTRPGRLVIEGGSNGGLLTAACSLQRPDLYGAVLCRVPVIDMLRYHLFTIGAYWKSDYGDPEDPEQFKALLAYSPAHNVRPGIRYPAMLITTADTDTRVHPMHAKKFAAALQAAQAGDAPILLRVETKAGHGGGKPTSKIIEERADLYAFVMDRLGMTLVPAAGGTSTATRGAK